MEPVYLDYNASAPLRPDILALMADIWRHPGNASSVHGFGRTARKHVEEARSRVAELVGVKPAQVIFNSGATEGNNTVLHAYQSQRVLVSAIEHPSVLYVLPQAETIPVTQDGVIDLDALHRLITQGQPPALISVMTVNSETGVIQPIQDIAQMAKACGAHLHTDSVQAAGRIALDMTDMGADYLTLSAHKMGGPQGVGALIVRRGLDIPRYILGGSQETLKRAGTHNTAGIAGMGLAAEIARKSLPDYNRIRNLRDMMEQTLLDIAPEARIFGAQAPRVGNTTDIALPGVDAQIQMMALDLDGVAVSSGSACSSGTFKPSHVLKAMGAEENTCRSALRISLGYGTTASDIDRLISAWKKMYMTTRAGS
jgi:cysteine desulfurase